MKFAVFFAVLSILTVQALADTPANCTYEDIRGVWRFMESQRGLDKNFDCTCFQNFTSDYYVQLYFPNIATDMDGNVGFWTIIYNQGFEVVINGRKWFAFSFYTQDGDNVTSICNTTFQSTSHDVGIDPKNWSCFKGVKQDATQQSVKVHHVKNSQLIEELHEKILYQTDFSYIDKINKAQSKWKAGHYDFLNKRTLNDLRRMAGGKNSIFHNKPKPAKPTLETLLKAQTLPESFDWRNVSGVNYLSPVRDQGTCGSCYAYGSMAMHEARLRVKSLNRNTTVFSTQDIVSCSKYSQGCEGGFPYLVAGKYTEDYGIVEDKCNPYTGQDSECKTDPTCTRNYGTNYRYIGGFYGGCNEPLMRISLVQDGPIAVSFEVYDDFMSYKGGIYHHTGIQDTSNFKFNPWEITNHVVLIVGYGVDQASGDKFWIVKNSWSTNWGEDGFFRIMRGNDECSIESIAVEADILV